MYVPIGQSHNAVLSSPGRCSAAPLPRGPFRLSSCNLSIAICLSIYLIHTDIKDNYNKDDDDDDDDGGQQCLRAMHACIIPTVDSSLCVCVCGFFMMYPGVEVAPS